MKRVGALVLFGAIALSLSACNVSPPAATVNGVAIPQSALRDELNRLSSQSTVRCALGILAGQVIPAHGAGSGTIPTSIADAELSQLIDQQLYTQDLAKHHSPVDKQYQSYARAFMAHYFTPASGSSSCGMTGSALVSALPKWFLNQQVSFLATEEKLVSVVGHVDLGPQGIQTFYKQNPDDFAKLCFDVIAESTQAAAKSDDALLRAGHSFAAVAATSDNGKLAQDGFQTDGSYGCEYASQVLEEQPDWAGALDQAGLKVGSVTAPFLDSSQSDDGGTNDWLIVKLTERQEVPLSSSIATDIQGYLVSENANAFVTEQAKVLKGAKVTVDPQYGSWSPGTKKTAAGVIGPSTPKPEFLLNSNVNS